MKTLNKIYREQATQDRKKFNVMKWVAFIKGTDMSKYEKTLANVKIFKNVSSRKDREFSRNIIISAHLSRETLNWIFKNYSLKSEMCWYIRIMWSYKEQGSKRRQQQIQETSWRNIFKLFKFHYQFSQELESLITNDTDQYARKPCVNHQRGIFYFAIILMKVNLLLKLAKVSSKLLMQMWSLSNLQCAQKMICWNDNNLLGFITVIVMCRSQSSRMQ